MTESGAPMEKVAMYLRKSRAEELTDTVDETLKRHKEALTEFAQRNNLLISSIYEEVVSGESLYARPQMLKLLSNVEHGDYDAVLCMDIDRLGRGTMSDQGVILETLKASDTKIITPRKIYDLNNDIDETYSEFESFMARQELKVIKRRMQRGLKRTIEDGGYIANAPYGYKKVYADRHPTLEIVENEARIVRVMFDLYTNKGYGCQRIADTVNAMGAKPRRSDRFVRISIMKILRNPTYIGKIVWNQKTQIRKGVKGNNKTQYIYHPRDKWIIVQGLHRPIVEESLFNKTQDIITKHTHPPANTGVVENSLAGLVYCSHCGALMQRQRIRHSGEYLMCQKRGCMVSSSLPLVENAVLDALKEKLSKLPIEAKNVLTQPQDESSEIIDRIFEERRIISHQADKLHDLLEQGVYPIDTFLMRRKMLSEKLEKLDAAEKQIVSSMNRINLKMQNSAIKNVLELYDKASRQERNELLKTVIEKIVYDKKKEAKPGEFSLNIYFTPFCF